MSAHRLREIPYNYTSFSDQEIVTRFLGREMWDVLDELRGARRTGRSARMLFEVLGDMWVTRRNPYIQDDLIGNAKRWQSLTRALHHRLDQIVARSEKNPRTLALVAACREAVNAFEAWLSGLASQRQRIRHALGRATHPRNVDFGGMSRVSHSTDATDWRVELPLVVVSPDSEAELQRVVAVSIELGLTIIPRGGGTGYTGGAIPLHADSLVINTEKLEGLGAVVWREIEGRTEKVPTIRAEAGVVTQRVSERAAEQGLVFAVDPTSQDASTIGGNVAMNAGGKKAVLWGTTIDNLLSWRMVTPNSEWIEVERINHNRGKIHDQATVVFRIHRFAADGATPIGEPETLELPGQLFRKQGLGKDVTDKFLGGLPGVQKEGCDGLITSAVFILHEQHACTRTVCLEFFGDDLGPAVSAIVAIRDHIGAVEGVDLAGLEHLDERYVRAVNYSTKAPRPGRPKVVLIADIAGRDEDRVAACCSEIVRIANQRDGEGFIAVSAEARQRFWKDRARTAAIAAHTNAFKINEDVVIPIERLVEYGEGIERINIVQSITNKIRMIDVFEEYVGKGLKNDIDREHAVEFDQEIMAGKLSAAATLLQDMRALWIKALDSLDAPGGELALQLGLKPTDGIESALLITLLRRRRVRISFRKSVERPLKEIFSGRAFDRVHRHMDELHADVRSSRLFVALHMHAGDGNVHTNIPVNSNDYAMLQEAERIVDQVMELATTLGGVISGEHGIGLTKMQYLDREVIDRFAEYKQAIDPEGRFNRGKLMAGSGLEQAYTPSLRLLQQEALILEESELGALNDEIRHCLRCGKCKPVCTTHVPRANLPYSPRNKILATGLIIEAFLYEEQTRRGLSLQHFDAMGDVADHCTVCHRCLPACPVDIDFGDVSIMMRRILADRGRRRPAIGTRLAMAFLNASDPDVIRLMRKGMIQWGFRAQRMGYRIFKWLHPRRAPDRPGPTTEQPTVSAQVVHFVKRPLPAHVPAKTTRALLGIENDKFIPILRDPSTNGDDAEAVFYFPGCGSERLFSEVGLATLAMLYQTGAQTVLPPGYLCCGYPQISSGDEQKGRQITTANRVLFHRVANTLNYLDIRTVIVSCGTCMDQLLKYEFEQIFPGCRLLDIHEYLQDKGVSMQDVGGVQYLYHDPCHTPIKTRDPIDTVSSLMGKPVTLSDRCCGEAGTFAVSRPDIADQVRFRKAEELHKGIQTLTGQERTDSDKVKLLTSCPACQQGLSRYADETGLETTYMVVELAKNHLGDGWQNSFSQKVLQGGIERVLL